MRETYQETRRTFIHRTKKLDASETISFWNAFWGRNWKGPSLEIMRKGHFRQLPSFDEILHNYPRIEGLAVRQIEVAIG